jgi:hypothetical protein
LRKSGLARLTASRAASGNPSFHLWDNARVAIQHRAAGGWAFFSPLRMQTFDFDTVPERRGTDSQKWQKYAGRDVLPLWVADMDFKSAPPILEALHRRVEHGIFGYARPVAATTEAVVAAMQAGTTAGPSIPSWIVWLPGLVVGLNVTAQAFAAAGDEVLTLTPVYPPFMSAPRNSGRVPVGVPFVRHDGAWAIDWEALERAVTPRTKLFFLCNPHNPLARVWRRAELERLAEFCAAPPARSSAPTRSTATSCSTRRCPMCRRRRWRRKSPRAPSR